MGIFDKILIEIYIKIVMLGYCFVGKISFFVRFIYNRFYKIEVVSVFCFKIV